MVSLQAVLTGLSCRLKTSLALFGIRPAPRKQKSGRSGRIPQFKKLTNWQGITWGGPASARNVAFSKNHPWMRTDAAP